jgi:hypothetical protein
VCSSVNHDLMYFRVRTRPHHRLRLFFGTGCDTITNDLRQSYCIITRCLFLTVGSRVDLAVTTICVVLGHSGKDNMDVAN